ncbi:NrtA/SsuA/CpmA family ABC transporter substrate-binding protein [Alphaproteobacteria bacterium LMO-S08]|nr:NrtA/SsuA/CpmA family ABC transporter substrate-binding protein [Alphaproteobacteria bacterium LMO-S08]
MISRLKAGGLAAALAAVLFAGPAEAAKFKATLAQNMSPISGVTIVAKDKGFFEKHGLDISVSGFTSGKQCLNAVLGGAADIATTAEAPTTAAAMSKQPIAFLARMEYSDLKTLTAAASGIKSLADLKGKKIAFTAGTGSEVYTVALLKKAGLSKSDVKLTNLRPQDMLPALSAGDIDAYNTWEPHVSNGVKAMGAKVAELDTKGIYAETFNIVVMKSYLKDNPELISAFLKALLEAEAWMKANPEEAIATVAKVAGMKADALAAIWKDYVYNVVLDQKQLDVLTAHAAWRLESGNHPPGATMPDFSTVIVPGPLKAVAPDRVTIP